MSSIAPDLPAAVSLTSQSRMQASSSNQDTDSQPFAALLDAATSAPPGPPPAPASPPAAMLTQPTSPSPQPAQQPSAPTSGAAGDSGTSDTGSGQTSGAQNQGSSSAAGNDGSRAPSSQQCGWYGQAPATPRLRTPAPHAAANRPLLPRRQLRRTQRDRHRKRDGGGQSAGRARATTAQIPRRQRPHRADRAPRRQPDRRQRQMLRWRQRRQPRRSRPPMRRTPAPTTSNSAAAGEQEECERLRRQSEQLTLRPRRQCRANRTRGDRQFRGAYRRRRRRER